MCSVNRPNSLNFLTTSNAYFSIGCKLYVVFLFYIIMAISVVICKQSLCVCLQLWKLTFYANSVMYCMLKYKRRMSQNNLFIMVAFLHCQTFLSLFFEHFDYYSLKKECQNKKKFTLKYFEGDGGWCKSIWYIWRTAYYEETRVWCRRRKIIISIKRNNERTTDVVSSDSKFIKWLIRFTTLPFTLWGWYSPFSILTV